MSKVLIFSDLHIHAHKKKYERLQDCLDALVWVFETAKSHKIKNIIFCGDLFHDRQKIELPTYHKTFETFQKYLTAESAPEIWLLIGNHDMWFSNKWDVSSVFPLASIKGVHVIDKPCTQQIDGHELSFLPYTHNPIQDLKQIYSMADYKVLFGHCAVDGAVWNVRAGTLADVSIEHDGDMLKVTPDVFDEYDRVFLGHYHGEQKLSKKVEYVGSPLQLSFGEAFERKHVIIYDLESHKREYIENEFSPQHFIIPESDVDKIKLENNFVRLMVEDITDVSLIDKKNEIVGKKVASLEIKQKPKEIKAEMQTVADVQSIIARSGEMLEKYVELKNPDNLDKSVLLDIGQDICNSYTED